MIVYDAINDRSSIGEYKTEERAKEILKEIINKYRAYSTDMKAAITFPPKVYRMPLN